MEVSFFLRLAGRVMVFPEANILPTLAVARKEVGDAYLEALEKVIPKAKAADLTAAWKFFDAGLGQSLIDLSEDVSPAEQADHWIEFGVRGLAGGTKESSSHAPAKKPNDQEMLFDL